MRYHELMVEAIPHRPRNLKVYLTLRIKELDQMLADLARAKELITQGDKEGGESMLHRAIRYKDYDSESWVLTTFNLDREFQIERLKGALETYLQFGNKQYNFLGYVISALDDAKKYERPELLDRYRKAFELLPYAEAGLEQYGYEPGHPDTDSDPEYNAAHQVLTGYRLKHKVFQRIVPLEDDMRTKFGVIQRMRYHDSMMLSSDKYHPEHGEVETLYHATAFVKEILRDGFSAEKPKERVGVGNFGHQEVISFSHDLEISRNIMRAFKELWMIAHHQLTGPQILSWARAEGIEDGIKQSWGGIEGNRPLPVGRNANPHEVAKLYRYWLSHSKLRDDPMLIYPWEIVDMLKNRQLSDIGVLACQVRLEQTDEYRFAEAEFRLPADRVLSVIKQVL